MKAWPILGRTMYIWSIINIKKIILWEVQWSQDMIDELHRI